MIRKEDMKQRFIAAALTAVALLLSASPSFAADDKAAAPLDTKAGVSAKVPAKSAPKRNAAALAKPVDINKASIKELKKLPGVSDEIAAKIVAGRPYPSKADLVTRNIIDSGVYSGIRKSIEARQPYKDAKKNAALYIKQK